MKNGGFPGKDVPMRIIYHGHSEFSLITGTGAIVLTDPCDPAVGYGNGAAVCQAVTVSHGHHDHNWTQKCPADAVVVDQPGTCSPLPDVKVTMYETFHDGDGGAKRGKNLMALVEMDGLRILHCGDLGHVPDADLIAGIGSVDVLLVPVGGFYTIDAAQAAETAQLLNARVVNPMHYKTEVNADWPIAGVDAFLTEMNASMDEKAVMPTVRIAKGDLSEQKRICVLEIKPHQV